MPWLRNATTAVYLCSTYCIVCMVSWLLPGARSSFVRTLEREMPRLLGDLICGKMPPLLGKRMHGVRGPRSARRALLRYAS